jgi:methylthioribose-1-phosphate isomerase
VKVNGTAYRTIWASDDRESVHVIDQRRLPHRFAVERLRDVDGVRAAIAEMWVRGAPLIGAAAAYGLALQANKDASEGGLRAAAEHLQSARPTAVNLAWALQRMLGRLLETPEAERIEAAWQEAAAIANEDVKVNEAIGEHGLQLLRTLHDRLQRPIQVLTHCNAGWLATVDWGTALAPIYKAQAAGLPLHVWVDETRPRNQGASLTAWELAQQRVPHTLIADNTGGHLMQRGEVDVVIVGCDRVTLAGDVCNKIGTYLKALAARDNGVAFYAAMPLSTLDPTLHDGNSIPIEQRSPRELTHIAGRDADGRVVEVQLTPDGCEALNPAFDVTPHRLVTGLITERGVVPAEEGALRALIA